MNNRGFVIEDALICLFITICLCLMCFMSYNMIDMYENGFKDYQIKSLEEYTSVFSSLEKCEKCQIEEKEDSSKSKQ